jgi:outer membrane protein assembly factor BamB
MTAAEALRGLLMFKRITLIVALWSVAAQAGDWASWRGPLDTGYVPEKAVVTTWSPEGDQLLWHSPIGGRTTPLVMKGRVFFNTLVGEGNAAQERVVCLNAKTGELLWDHRFNVFLTTIVEQRVAWSAMVGDAKTGRVYVHGTGGELICFGRDGDIQWRRSMTEQFGRISGYGGRLHNPILYDDFVVITFSNSNWGPHAKPLHRLLALDKHTGEVVWWSSPGKIPIDKTCYSTPTAGVVNGRHILAAGNGDGHVYGMDGRTGERLWSFEFSKRGLNSSVVLGGKYAYACHSEENLETTQMGAVVCIDASKRGVLGKEAVVWRVDGLTAGYASPALANGRLYIADNSANLIALDARTGAQHWQHNFGRVGKASPVVTSDGVIYIAGQNGNFNILRDAGERCEVLHRHEFARSDELVDEAYGSAAVVDGRVYFQTRYGTYCLGKAGAVVEPAVVSSVEPVSAAGYAGQRFLLITPGEVSLTPGRSASFYAELHDHGRVVVDPDGAKWSLKGLNGTLHDDGTFEAAMDAGFSAGQVIVKVGDLQASARVRVAPRVPFEVDFETHELGSIPAGWIGVAGKTRVVEREGGRVLKKLAEKPSVPFTRIRGYMAEPQRSGYTVQADLLGAPKGKRFKPDMGVINSRYTFIMRGMAQGLRIVSWSPVPRIQKDVPFEWQTDVWYTVKFEVSPAEGKKAQVRAKVWPRDSTEPEEWHVELVDDYPNTAGSPGLYGYSTGTTSKSNGTEIFYDNIRVTRNE